MHGLVTGRHGRARAIESLLAKGSLRLALYDELTGTIRFPTVGEELLERIEAGSIADALPWLLRADSFAPAGGVVFDVGGLRGITAQFLARRARHVHVFEPVPDNAKSIRLASSARGIANLTVHEVALGRSAGVSRLHLCRGPGHGSLGKVHTSAPKGCIEVPTTTVDEVCEKHGIDAISFLKIDVEGFELEVLQGARGMLSRRKVGAILFENNVHVLTDLGRSGGEVFEYMTELGYRVTNLDGKPVERQELDGAYGDYLALPA